MKKRIRKDPKNEKYEPQTKTDHESVQIQVPLLLLLCAK